MSPKKRDNKNADLSGTNIKVVNTRDADGNRMQYFYYVMPDGSQQPLIHNDRKSSIEAALELNRILRPSGKVVDRIIQSASRPTSKNPPFSAAAMEFKEWFQARGYSKSYTYESMLRVDVWLREPWSNVSTGSVDTFTISQFLKTLVSDHERRKHINLLKHCFLLIAENGYENKNPMQQIRPVTQPKRQRMRHTWDGRKAIYEAAPAWLQVAMDAALYTLQRRADLVSLRIGHQIDLKNKTITVLQKKTQNYDRPVHIQIAMGEELYNAVTRSRLELGINSDYLIKCRQRSPQARHKQRSDPFSVSPDYLTKAYSSVRDKIGVYDHIEDAKMRPGLHSERALGIWLYTKAGYPDEYIQALSGHATADMMRSYAAGHEKAQPVVVQAGLDMSQVALESIDWETDLSPTLRKLADSGE